MYQISKCDFLGIVTVCILKKRVILGNRLLLKDVNFNKYFESTKTKWKFTVRSDRIAYHEKLKSVKKVL